MKSLIKRNRAFTLIELMIVITIISLLSAMLFPVLVGAKAAAEKTMCLSNQMQISLAWTMYATDYDDMMGSLWYIDANGGPPGNLYARVTPFDSFFVTSYSPLRGGFDFTKGLIYPYVNDPPLHDCPAAAEISNYYGMYPLSFGINMDIMQGCDWVTEGLIGYGGACQASYHPASMGAVTEPSETIFMADNAAGKYDSTYTYLIEIQRNSGVLSVYLGGDGGAHGRHATQANVVWLDGHTKSMPVNLTLTLRSEADGEFGPGNTILSSNHLGDIVKPGAIIPPGDPFTLAGGYGTPVTASYAYYYLLDK